MYRVCAESAELTSRLRDGQREALAELFARHRARLTMLVRLRIDPRLQGRLDPSDVVQETWLEAEARRGELGTAGINPAARRDDPAARDQEPAARGAEAAARSEHAASPYLWLRFLTLQRLLILHRRHLGTQMRDAKREVSLAGGSPVDVSSVVLAGEILDSCATPSKAVARAESEAILRAALDDLGPIDREILTLRHFEQLDNNEVAAVLAIPPATASQRYYRALKRLREALGKIGGDWSR